MQGGRKESLLCLVSREISSRSQLGRPHTTHFSCGDAVTGSHFPRSAQGGEGDLADAMLFSKSFTAHDFS